MLPSLHELRIDKDTDTEARTKIVNKVTIKKKEQKPERHTQRSDLKVLDEFPIDVPKTVPLEILFRIPDLIFETSKKSRWVFSSNTVITALRLDENSYIGQEHGEDWANAFVAIDTLETRFANQVYDPRFCGTYNCFEKSVSLVGNHIVQKSLRNIIKSLHESIPSFNMPKTVAVRAPRRSAHMAYNPEKTRESRDEVALTLFMANNAISPPVYAAFPVKTRGVDDALVVRDFAYITESGWHDFEDFLDQLGTHTSHPEFAANVESLSSSVLQVFRDLADTHMLCTDLKLKNMVARQVGDKKFEVKMIDFGAQFTFDVNKFVTYQGQYTVTDCVFFVNALLLANYVLLLRAGPNPSRDHRHVFRALMNEAARIWEAMVDKDSFSGFCWVLFNEESFPAHLRGEEVDIENMQIVPEAMYVEKSRDTFFGMLKHYGNDDVLQVHDKAQYTEKYITRLVKRMKSRF